MQITKSNHDQEVHRLQSELELVGADLGTTKAALSDSQAQALEQRGTISNLNDEVEKLSKLHTNVTDEVSDV